MAVIEQVTHCESESQECNCESVLPNPRGFFLTKNWPKKYFESRLYDCRMLQPVASMSQLPVAEMSCDQEGAHDILMMTGGALSSCNAECLLNDWS